VQVVSAQAKEKKAPSLARGLRPRARGGGGWGETQPTGVKNPRQGATFRNEGARLTTHDRAGAA
jgi:hypothetical protein